MKVKSLTFRKICMLRMLRVIATYANTDSVIKNLGQEEL